MKKYKMLFFLVVFGFMGIGILVGCLNDLLFLFKGIINIVFREEGFGICGVFIELFGIELKNKKGEKVDYIFDVVIVINLILVMLIIVFKDLLVIGYFLLGLLNSSVKVFKIDGKNVIVKDIKLGSYKIFCFFNIVIKEGKEKEVIKDFIDYILSKDG